MASGSREKFWAGFQLDDPQPLHVGPVVDLAGHVVGLNIARADRTRTLAIPADVLQKVISELRQQAEGAVK